MRLASGYDSECADHSNLRIGGVKFFALAVIYLAAQDRGVFRIRVPVRRRLSVRWKLKSQNHRSGLGGIAVQQRCFPSCYEGNVKPHCNGRGSRLRSHRHGIARAQRTIRGRARQRDKQGADAHENPGVGVSLNARARTRNAGMTLIQINRADMAHRLCFPVGGHLAGGGHGFTRRTQRHAE
jgi:hypothetical protein